jgi:hypothetical protein
MDSLLTDTALAVLVAAKAGLLKPVTDGVRPTRQNNWRQTWKLVTARFAKDGPAPARPWPSWKRHPTTPRRKKPCAAAWNSCSTRTQPSRAEIKAIIGELKIDQSVHQTAQAGDNSSITQVSGSHNTVVGKA